MDTKADTMRFGIGQGITRKEDQRFLTGRGRYVSDIKPMRRLFIHPMRTQ
jgi:aerobic carbon-monoxide dehydrogenase large subunit